jgi:hypothetical protein
LFAQPPEATTKPDGHPKLASEHRPSVTQIPAHVVLVGVVEGGADSQSMTSGGLGVSSCLLEPHAATTADVSTNAE